MLVFCSRNVQKLFSSIKLKKKGKVQTISWPAGRANVLRLLPAAAKNLEEESDPPYEDISPRGSVSNITTKTDIAELIYGDPDNDTEEDIYPDSSTYIDVDDEEDFVAYLGVVSKRATLVSSNIVSVHVIDHCKY